MPHGVSRHAVDRLIRALIRTGRPATMAEIERIVERMATVPLNHHVRRVPRRGRGASYPGRAPGTTADSSGYNHSRPAIFLRSCM